MYLHEGNVRPWARLLLAFAWLLLLGAAGCSDDDTPKGKTDGTVQADAGPETDSGPEADSQPPVQHKALSLKVAHVNDTHAQLESQWLSVTYKNAENADEKANTAIGGFSRLAAKIKGLRATSDKLLFLHAGDVFQGSLYFTQNMGRADSAFLDAMKLDAQALGNHEFDKDSKVLAEYAKGASYPLLAANVDVSKDAELKDVIKPFVIKQVDGEPVGIIGLTTPDTPNIAAPGKDIVFNEAEAAATAAVKELEAQGVNKIIALTHLGHEADLALAAKVEGIDAIVGGHSHTLLGEFGLGLSADAIYPATAKTPAGKTVCVVQSWEKARGLGLLEIELDAAGDVQKCGGESRILASDKFQQYNATTKQNEDVPADKQALFSTQLKAAAGFEVLDEDADALKMLEPYKATLETLRQQEIADVAEDLLHVRIPGSTHKASGKLLENGSQVAPLVAQALLWKAQGIKAQIALINAGGPRTDILQGRLTMGEVYELMPFGNQLYVLELTGAQLKDQIEKAVNKAVAETGGPFPYLAGARYTADMTKPEGSRITAFELGAGTTWTAIDAATTYKVATLNFLATGGDGYSVFKGLPATARHDLGNVDAEVFAEWATATSPLKPPADLCVTFIPAPPSS